MQSVSISLRGTKRVVNQDYFFADDTKGIYMVADGMGGHKAGEVASHMVIRIISETLVDDKSTDSIVKAFDEANIAVLNKSKQSEDYKGMGTTVVVCFVDDDMATIAHVGDSRAYMLSCGKLRLVTKDHSLVKKLLESGQITEQEALTHPMKNMIYKAIGMEEKDCFDRIKDMCQFEVQNGDIILLCSDGLSGAVVLDKIQDVLLNENFENLPKILGNMAVEDGSTDDITIIVIKI